MVVCDGPTQIIAYHPEKTTPQGSIAVAASCFGGGFPGKLVRGRCGYGAPELF